MFFARIKTDASGLELGSDWHRANFKKFLQENKGARVKLELMLPESRKQRGYLEGCVVSLIAFYQEGMDHRNPNDLRKVREWLHQEFNSELVVVAGKIKTVGKSTKGRKELNAFLERVMDWLVEQYAPPAEAIDPGKYKLWRDTVFPFEQGPDNYIDYLQECGILRKGEKSA